MHEYEYVCMSKSMCVYIVCVCVYTVRVHEYEYVCVSMCVNMCVYKCVWTLMRRWIRYMYMCECTLGMPTISA